MLEHLESAMRPASSREVAACAEELCGKRLSWRRDALRAVIDGRLQPLLPEQDANAQTLLDGAPSGLTPAGMPSQASVSHVTSSTDATLAPRESGRIAMVAAVASAVTVSAILLAFWFLALRPAEPSPATSAPTGSAPAQLPVTPNVVVEVPPSATAPAASETHPTPSSTAPRWRPRSPSELHDNPYGTP
jgi:hypothetical protein